MINGVSTVYYSGSSHSIRAVKTTDEAALVELAHDSIVDQLLGLHLVNVGISGAQEPVHIAHAFHGGRGISLQAFQDILVTFFSQGRIAHFQPRLDGVDHCRLVLRAKSESNALDQTL